MSKKVEEQLDIPTKDEQVHHTKTHKKRRFLKNLSSMLILLVVFGVGYGLGSGRIVWGQNAAIKKTAQKNLPANLDYRSVEEVYDTLKGSYDGTLESETLLDGLKEGLAQSTGDPYTEYLSEEEYKEFDQELSGSFTGIGAELSKEDKMIQIVAPIAGFPAEKAGLKAKDVITEIDDKSAYDISVSEAVKSIRGPKGTKVKLKVIRDQKQELTFDIERDNINIPSVESKILDGNIGYLKISRFSDDTVVLSRQAAQDFKAKNVKGVVVDVRNDPGGLLDAAVDISSLWLNKKTVLTERRGDVTVRSFTSRGEALLAGIPTVVLINEGSASASEILAGALKDNKAATLIGTKSYGKGSVQQLENLRLGGVLKVTIARWYTPAGKNIDKEGIEPDQKVELTEEDFKAKRDPQQDAAVQFLNR